jgi:hypothetical protein
MNQDDDEITIEESPEPKTEKPVDVDATWDSGKCSLDEHRHKEFAKIKQPGFGDLGKVKSDGK